MGMQNSRPDPESGSGPVAPEDLVLLKAVAVHRDRVDIHGIVAAYGAELDRGYLENWACRLDVDLGVLGQSGSS